jgi:flagellar protein FliO/FliZ
MDSVSFFWSFFKMLASLALVIALMIAAMWVLKKYFYQAPAISSGNAMIDILSTRHLGPKNSFLLVEVLGQVLLVGVSAQEMSLLATITDPEALARLKAQRLSPRPSPPPDPLGRYKSLLKSLGRGRKDG